MTVCKEQKNWIKLIGITLTVYLVFRYILPLVIPFLLAGIVAVVLRPVLRFGREKLHICEKWFAPVLLLLLSAATTIFLSFVLVILCKQASNLVRQLPGYEKEMICQTKNICDGIDGMTGVKKGRTYSYVCEEAAVIFKNMSNLFLSKATGMASSGLVKIASFFFSLFVFLVAAWMFMIDRKSPWESMWMKKIHPYYLKLKETGFSYIRAQLIIISVVSTLSTIGLYLAKNPYALLFGICIGLLDALPLIGSGTILIPYALFCFFQGEVVSALILIGVFIATLLVREILEPKLLSNCFQAKPVVMLMSIYVGMGLFSVAGLILGPLGFIIIRIFMQSENRDSSCETD